MDKFTKLNFPPVRFRAVKKDGIISIWDDIRKEYIILTPEEWVRQHLIAMLINDKHVHPIRIVEEFPVNINGLPQRADVIVLGTDMQPILLIECKAPSIKIDEQVFSQAVRYNHIIKARYIMLTNGLKHNYYQTEDAIRYKQIADLPEEF